jgi:NAD(P) transhydrogenase subunit beta
MASGLLTVSYLAASVLFVLSLGGLSQHETARRGNIYGVVGFLLAAAATFAFDPAARGQPTVLLATLAGGAGIGAVLAARVQMTAMPQLVAILHSFVGLAAVLVGFGGHLSSLEGGLGHTGASALIHDVEVFVGVFIGAVTFTGSIVAFGKLQEIISGKPLLLPGRHLLNVAMLAACVVLGWFFVGQGEAGTLPLLAMTAVASVIGVHLVLAIGGADMPVVVSMLNSYSGWAASATGFMLANDLLIVTGALVGSSGAILSYIMCKAMNRSFVSVILGGFGTAPKTASTAQTGGEVRSLTLPDTVSLLKTARRVIIIPGYGMAVAQAQQAVREITMLLRDAGIDVRFAIHPVAGRLPGHMNVLLAEANLPYDIVLEMDEINGDFAETDVALVIGANDIVNPGALDDPGSPIYGMPVLECWKSRQVVVLKRGMAAGYAGVDNPLFYKDNVFMLFGDAKRSVDGMLTGLRQA